jgi:hypothetical protein
VAVTKPNLLLKHLNLQTFVQTMVALEKEVANPLNLSSEEMARLGDMKALFALVPPNETALPNLTHVTRSRGGDLCSLLCSYRLLDVLYDLENPTAPTAPKTNPQYQKLSQAGLRPASSVSQSPFFRTLTPTMPLSNGP